MVHMLDVVLFLSVWLRFAFDFPFLFYVVSDFWSFISLHAVFVFFYLHWDKRSRPLRAATRSNIKGGSFAILLFFFPRDTITFRNP